MDRAKIIAMAEGCMKFKMATNHVTSEVMQGQIKMAAFSMLRFCGNGFRTVMPPMMPKLSMNSVACKGIVRCMSGGDHKRTMIITPTRFQWKKFKDYMHLYFMLGAIPLGTLIFLVNVFIGQAELSEIPEGYVPHNYEYYNHPIKRWFSRHLYKTEQEHYEKYLHFICAQEEQRQMKFIEKKVHELMATRGDYKGWHYKTITGKYHRIVREDEERSVTDYHGQDE